MHEEAFKRLTDIADENIQRLPKIITQPGQRDSIISSARSDFAHLDSAIGRLAQNPRSQREGTVEAEQLSKLMQKRDEFADMLSHCERKYQHYAELHASPAYAELQAKYAPKPVPVSKRAWNGIASFAENAYFAVRNRFARGEIYAKVDGQWKALIPNHAAPQFPQKEKTFAYAGGAEATYNPKTDSYAVAKGDATEIVGNDWKYFMFKKLRGQRPQTSARFGELDAARIADQRHAYVPLNQSFHLVGVQPAIPFKRNRPQPAKLRIA